MVTKKQKHAAALAKREAYLAKVKADGLAALEADRKRQKERQEEVKAAVEEINDRHRKILERERMIATKQMEEAFAEPDLDALAEALHIGHDKY